MRYIATGRVHPERADVHIAPCSWTGQDGHEVTVSCEASQITVVLKDAPVDGYVAAYLMAEHVARRRLPWS